jgi:adenine-specific DNA-methyltransferase
LDWKGRGLKLEPRILIEDPEKSYGEPKSENMLIHGDNLLALKALEQDFVGRIKCIYIDPPYNTGSAFEHYDDNLEHSTWLNLMKPRLEILKNLLSKDGVIWVSIDDTEQAYLKILLDEVFGRSNFVSNITVIVKTEGRRYGHLAKTHEFLVCYAKNFDECVINELAIENRTFQFKDEYSGYDLRELRNQNTRAFNSLNRPNLRYPFYVDENRCDKDGLMPVSVNEVPGFTKIWAIETNGLLSVWRWGKETASKEISNLIARKGNDGVIRIFQKNRSETTMAKTVWFEKEFITNRGTKESQTLFKDQYFSFPKPESLIHRILLLATSKGDFVLDSFLGSGTTSAVAHKMGRKHIGIEFGNHANTHCLPRLKKVVDGNDGLALSETLGWNGGGGFKFYSLAPSLLRKDSFGNFVIDERYNANMLAAAMCKHEGFKYYPDETLYWKQGKSTETDYIFITTSFVTVEQLDKIHSEMKEDESLLICAKSFASECEKRFADITIKKIPNMILGKCEFGKDNYDLNIINAIKVEAEE